MAPHRPGSVFRVTVAGQVSVQATQPGNRLKTVSWEPPALFPVHTANATPPPMAAPLYSPMRNVLTVSTPPQPEGPKRQGALRSGLKAAVLI